MAKIVDPDQLNQATEVVIATGAKTIQLLVAGNLDDTSPGSTSGVTLQAVYSFLKEEWKSDNALNKFRFPLQMFTKTDGQFINGWTFADAQSRDLVRDGGWTEGASVFAGFISLGNFDAVGDQGYYVQATPYNSTTTLFDKTGNLNEPVDITGATAYIKSFLREQGKLYAEYALVAEQGLALLEPVLYRQPLENANDIDISSTDVAIDTTTPFMGTSDHSDTDGDVTAASPTFNSANVTFVAGDVGNYITITAGSNIGKYRIVTFTDASNVDVDRNFGSTESAIAFDVRQPGMKLNYLGGALFEQAQATTYAIGDVVLDGDSPARWAWCTGAGTVVTETNPYATFGGTSTWEAYDGEIQIGANYYAFNRIMDANNGSAAEVYEWLQRQLRSADTVVDINEDDSTTVGQRSGTVMNGELAELLAFFVGSNLHTEPGLGITNFDVNSTNDLTFGDITVDGGGVDATSSLPVTSTERTFPFVAAGTLEFSANLVAETDADTRYVMYFDNAGGSLFDTSAAIIVDDDGGTDIDGLVTAASIVWDFDYDGNVQGGRTAATDALVHVVAQGLPDSQWVEVSFTITRATGQTITVTSPSERNYANPV